MVDLPVPSPPLLSSPSAPVKRPASSPPPVHAQSPPPPASKKSATAPKRKAARSQLPAAEQQPAVLPSHYRLPLQGAEVYYLPEFVPAETASGWYDALLGVEGWYQPTLKMYGKEITQSRKICAYATDPSLTVKYSGALVKMQYSYPPLLRQIQDQVEHELGVTFNHVMMNLYEDGKVYIGNHRDNKENRVIASLSLGAERTFIMSHAPLASAAKNSPTIPASATTTSDAAAEGADGGPPEDLVKYKKWTLANGSLLVQQGRTQEFYKHEIPKEAKVKRGRISLTFRQLVW